MSATDLERAGPGNTLLELATAIAIPETRLAAAASLGRELGGSHLLLFLRETRVAAATLRIPQDYLELHRDI